MTNESITHLVSIIPNDLKLSVKTDTNLLEILSTEGILLRSDCGGIGRCGKCQLLVSNGKPKSPKTGVKTSKLACKYTICSDVTVTIPSSSQYITQTVSKSINEKIFYELLAKESPENNETQPGYGLAIDLGTTTIGVYLCEFATRKIVVSAAVRNPQTILGLDVISRIGAINLDRQNLAKLQRMTVKTIETVIQSLFQIASLPFDQPRAMVFVGNSTMIHLLFGENPSSIGSAPYEPVFTNAQNVTAKEIGFSPIHTAKVYSPPLLSGFLGSDIIATALAVDFLEQPTGTLLIDMGTNGELMLKTSDGILATSCATGPAFEGANIGCGMPAMPGAIDKIRLYDNGKRIVIGVIGQENKTVLAEGICGSGIINAIAEFLRQKIILANGSFNSSCKLSSLRRDKKPVEFVIIPPNGALKQRKLAINQKDIRAIQLAKGALFSGIIMLCQKAAIKKPQKILVAGAFGNYLDMNDCLSIGLFGDFDNMGAIEIVGNAAGTGAALLLLANGISEKIDTLVKDVEVVNLSDWPDFQDIFVNAMSFPTVNDN